MKAHGNIHPILNSISVNRFTSNAFLYSFLLLPVWQQVCLIQGNQIFLKNLIKDGIKKPSPRFHLL